MLPIGHRFRTRLYPGSENQALTRSVRDREWCPVAITNSLCVKRVRVSQLLNTAESLRGCRRCSGRYPLFRPLGASGDEQVQALILSGIRIAIYEEQLALHHQLAIEKRAELLGDADRGSVVGVNDAEHAARPHRLVRVARSEEHTSELQSLAYLVCRLLLEKKKKNIRGHIYDISNAHDSI